MRKTKIVCTIGPSSRSICTLTDMARSGMNVARLNFSHGTHEYHAGTIEMIKQVRRELGLPIAIMLDTKGPEIRTGCFCEGGVELVQDESFTLTTAPRKGGADGCQVSFEGLPAAVSEGSRILIDDGKIELRAESVSGGDIVCRVVRGGKVSDHKGINLPGIKLDMPYLSDRDREDILFGVEQDVDFIAASFVRSKEDVASMRKFVNFNGGRDIRIISKIENGEGVDNFAEILRVSDGIMVARGDMGVEIEFERLPGLQKRFIKSCYSAGKMVITATQMLESMTFSPTPTRAEITDVANAVFDGTSAVMLSGETAAGKYPVEAVKVMAKIAERAEADAFAAGAYRGLSYDNDTDDVTNAVCDACCTLAKDINARAIVALSKYGQTARSMSKFRPEKPIVAATPVEKTYHQLSLSWGVCPVLAKYQRSENDLFLHAVDCAAQLDLVSEGDRVVIAAGIPLDTPGSTNTLRVETVGKRR